MRLQRYAKLSASLAFILIIQMRNWLTVGDVYSALQRDLSAEKVEATDPWSSFTTAISAETGVDPSTVTAETLLLGRGRFSWKISIVVAAVAAAVLTLLLRF